MPKGPCHTWHFPCKGSVLAPEKSGSNLHGNRNIIGWLVTAIAFGVAALPAQTLSTNGFEGERDDMGGGLLRLLPTTADPVVDPSGSSRTESICYHTGDAYFIKLPHPTWGDVGPLFQRITPGSGGELRGCKLRMLNEFNGNSFHQGEMRISVHRRTGTQPGPALQTLLLDAGDYGNGTFEWSFEQGFTFDAGQDFFLGLVFQPATPMDTLAYVTADIGDWTGHSFFYHEGETAWWGNPHGVAYGDMHFCALVDLSDRQPFLHFPWTTLDLGRCKADEEWSIELPILNQGTAPLVVNGASVDSPGWIVSLDGPDSLEFPDTLRLELRWPAPPAGTDLHTMLTLRSNAPDSVRSFPMHIATSQAEWLLSDWDEWTVEVLQFADSGPETRPWHAFSGLDRPGPFMGHDAPAAGLDVVDLLALRDLPVLAGSMLEFRWCQHLRHDEHIDRHEFAWRDPETGWWRVPEEGGDLSEAPWLTPEGVWATTPWLVWGPAPSTAAYDFGFLYGGTEAGDMWFIDDLEVRIRPPLAAPRVRISREASGLRLRWPAIAGADSYRVEELRHDGWSSVASVQDSSWCDSRRLTRRGRQGFFRVIAIDAPSPDGPGPIRVDPGSSVPLLREDR